MIITALSVGACSQDQKAGNGEKSGQSVGNSEKNIETDIQNKVLDIYNDAYSKFPDAENQVKAIVENLGNEGFAAVDIDNKINMACAEKLLSFVEKHNNKEVARFDAEKNCYIFRPRGYKETDYQDIVISGGMEGDFQIKSGKPFMVVPGDV